jgi:hypothetical protein
LYNSKKDLTGLCEVIRVYAPIATQETHVILNEKDLSGLVVKTGGTQ